MMKRKSVCGILALCLALSVAGCGKDSKEQQAANYYQNELGLDKEDAEELAHELYGTDEEEPSVPEEVQEETVVEPLPELVNSEWYDCKVQIYDMMFDTYMYMKEEDVRKIVEGSVSDVELVEGFDENGEVELKALRVDNYHVDQLYKMKYSDDGNDRNYRNAVNYGLLNDGNYYEVRYGSIDCWYDKASIEFKDLKTRDDVLAYLTENGFVEVEKEQAPYTYKTSGDSYGKIFPDEIPVEFADVPHYYCTGAQSITIFRVHKLGETDQVIERDRGRYSGTSHYSGAHLNLVNYVTFEFNTDGTINVPEFDPETNEGQQYYWQKAKLGDGSLPGWYLPDYYQMSWFTREFEIMGEQIDE